VQEAGLRCGVGLVEHGLGELRRGRGGAACEARGGALTRCSSGSRKKMRRVAIIMGSRHRVYVLRAGGAAGR
jgi:hypothetical protein